MLNYAYLMWDTEGEWDLKGVFATYEGAREALVQHLKDAYDPIELREWQEHDMPEAESVEEYLDAIRTTNKWDRIYSIYIQEWVMGA